MVNMNMKNKQKYIAKIDKEQHLENYMEMLEVLIIKIVTLT